MLSVLESKPTEYMKLELKHIAPYPMGVNGIDVRLPKHQIRYGQYHTYKLNGFFIGAKEELAIDINTLKI